MAPPTSSATFRLRLSSPGPFRLSPRATARIGRLVIEDVVGGIRAQRTLDGGPLKRNADSTIRRKVRQGKRPDSLVDEGRLVDPSTYSARAQGSSVRIAIGRGMGRVSGFLHRKGYVGWFGVGPRVLPEVRAEAAREVREWLRLKKG